MIGFCQKGILMGSTVFLNHKKPVISGWGRGGAEKINAFADKKSAPEIMDRITKTMPRGLLRGEALFEEFLDIFQYCARIAVNASKSGVLLVKETGDLEF